MRERFWQLLLRFERWVIAALLLIAFGFFLALAFRVGTHYGREQERFNRSFDQISDAGMK